jgi:hypothetical protein
VVAGAVSALLGPEHRRALVALLRPLIAAVPGDRARLTPAARAILAALDVDPLTSALRAELAVASLGASELVNQFEGRAESDALHADVLHASIAAVTAAAGRAGGVDLDDLEAALGSHHDARLRRLGLATLVARAGVAGWGEARLARLRAYRADPAPLVAAAAQFTFADGDAAAAGSDQDSRA